MPTLSLILPRLVGVAERNKQGQTESKNLKVFQGYTVTDITCDRTVVLATFITKSTLISSASWSYHFSTEP